MSFEIYRGHSLPSTSWENRNAPSAKDPAAKSITTRWNDGRIRKVRRIAGPTSETQPSSPLSLHSRSPSALNTVAEAEDSSQHRSRQFYTSNVTWLSSVSTATPSLVQKEEAASTEQSTSSSEYGKHGFGMFAYPPLKGNASGNLRLLRIDDVADNSSSNVYCTLVAAQPWVTGVHYECLSYCWGNSTTKGRLLIRTSEQTTSHYEEIGVSMNLCSAMHKLRSTHVMKWLWIDAICIDQSNLEERASQVAMMKNIYSNASGVVIWLGDSDLSLKSSVSTVTAISERFQADTGMTAASIVGPDGLRLSSVDIELLRSYDSSEILDSTRGDAYKLLAHFFALPWFRRVWVLQEAFAHNKIIVRLGEHTLPWGSVILAALWASGFTLSRARDFEASDPRDKVFALLGLANDIGGPQTRAAGLCPDYTKDKGEVYAAFAKDLIFTTGDLDVLSLVNAFAPRGQDKYLLSWMPNLDVPIATIRGLGFPRKYNACFSTTARMDKVTQQSQSPRTLILSGFCVDRVHYVTKNVMTFSRDLKVYTNENTEAVTELWKTFVRSVKSDTSENTLLSYIELLTATGFAMPTEFPAYPLGKIVSSREVPSVVADFAAYWYCIEPDFSSFSEPLRCQLNPLAEVGDAEQFGVLAGKACHKRKFFLTAEGRMGLCPRDTRTDDKVAILYGGSVPYILRETEAEDWTFIGECFVDGIMFGEAAKIQKVEQVFHLL
ncbi:Nn.00g032740.m01.CDS01 [Neocucurbitaria sp. VM-36]